MKRSDLSTREREIILLVSRGNTTHEIAEMLDLADQTVKNHMSSIREKLEARNAPHAVSISITRGLVII